MTDDRTGEKVFLLVVIAALIVFILQVTRAVYESGDPGTPSFYRLLIIVMLTLLAISVYALVKPRS